MKKNSPRSENSTQRSRWRSREGDVMLRYDRVFFFAKILMQILLFFLH